MDLDYSVPFNRHAWSDAEAFVELVDTVYASLPTKSQKELVGSSNNKGSMSVKDIIRVVLVDLYSTYKHDPKLCTGFARKHTDWTVKDRYNGQGIPRKIVDVVDALKKARYLRYEPGQSKKAGDDVNKRSRIQPTKKLKDLFKRLEVKSSSIINNHKRETILLRDKDADDENTVSIKYEDTPATISMRKVVESYNEMMQEHHVDVASLRKPFYVREDIDEQGEVTKEVIPIGPDHMFTYRVFSRGDTKFRKHGRWYGGFWQRLPKKRIDLRRDIYIDGEPTDEIDFCGLHPTLLALEHGKLLEGDKYDLGRPVLDTLKISEQRNIVKELVLIAINAKSKNAAYAAFNGQNKDKTLSHAELDQLLAAFIEKYPFLQGELCSDKGIDLMYTDSQITEAVIKRFVEADKPILPIHDSYIVKQIDRSFLKLIMKDACNEVLGHTLPFESEFDEEQQYIIHAMHYKHTDYDYYESVLSKHKTKVSKLYWKRYELWKEEYS
jgi:hypothetical protein